MFGGKFSGLEVKNIKAFRIRKIGTVERFKNKQFWETRLVVLIRTASRIKWEYRSGKKDRKSKKREDYWDSGLISGWSE